MELGVALKKSVITVSCAIVAVLPKVAFAGPMDTDLRIVSYNIYNRPWQRAARLERAQMLLGSLGADFVALQENARYFRSDTVPSELFAKALGYEVHTHWNEDGFIFSTGEAVLSRWPILDRGGLTFAQNRFNDAKGAAWILVDTPSGPLAVVSVHLVSMLGGVIKRAQLAELTALLKRLRERAPVLLAGDLNEAESEPLVRSFFAELQAQSWLGVAKLPVGMGSWAGGYGRACDDPEAELIDSIAVVAPTQASVSLVITAADLLRTQPPHPSDHCPLLARVQLHSP